MRANLTRLTASTAVALSLTLTLGCQSDPKPKAVALAVPTYADGFDFAQGLVEDTYGGDVDAAADEAFEVCQEALEYQMDQLYTKAGVVNSGGDHSYSELTKALGQSPVDALNAYGYGCDHGMSPVQSDRMNLAVIFDQSGPALADPYKVGHTYGKRQLDKITSIGLRDDPGRAARRMCRQQALLSLHSDPGEWGEGESGIEAAWLAARPRKAQRDFVAGCDRGTGET
ncbi:hypothetical protein [Streptomyces albidoflavus]|uniref:hypothetical protein n=1 Tax=Streptomyces albidoflavus TaxID=1886 RepID=UPI00332F601D